MIRVQISLISIGVQQNMLRCSASLLKRAAAQQAQQLQQACFLSTSAAAQSQSWFVNVPMAPKVTFPGYSQRSNKLFPDQLPGTSTLEWCQPQAKRGLLQHGRHDRGHMVCHCLQDPILGISEAFQACESPDKINLGVVRCRIIAVHASKETTQTASVLPVLPALQLITLLHATLA